jgi:large subunit ribosomal protein L17
MAVSLITHKRIFTTLAKAKELRKYVEPLITKSKEDTTHSRRIVFKNLRDKSSVTELFKEVSQKIGDRPGGYTRIIKTGNRLGDNASMCFIELVDYNELMLKDKKAAAKTKTRRSRRKSDGSSVQSEAAQTPVSKKKTEAPVETPSEKVPVAQPAAEAVVEEVKVVEAAAVEPVVEVAEAAAVEPVVEVAEATVEPVIEAAQEIAEVKSVEQETPAAVVAEIPVAEIPEAPATASAEEEKA